jgi:hypothetical protein
MTCDSASGPSFEARKKVRAPQSLTEKAVSDFSGP